MGKIGAFISKSILKTLGWKIKGEYASSILKKVMIAAPHTSGWDLPLGILVRTSIQADIQFVGKESLFKPPIGWIMKSLGGVPVDRSKNTNFVDMIVDVYNSRDKFSFMIAPEGTRKRVSKLKSGFYYVAHKAKVPIQMISLNYKDKIVEFSEPFYTSNDFEKDMEHVENYFRGVIGKRPEFSFY